MVVSKKNVLAAVSVISVVFILLKVLKTWTIGRLTFSVGRTWDGKEITSQKAEVTIRKGPENNVILEVRAPFYNDPPAPKGLSGEPFPQLWDYEVVEAFFLSESGKYLEVELCPHGQYLVLMLNGRRNMIRDKLPIHFTSQILNNEWTGTAVIPGEYFPPKVTKFNAYAIHGSGNNRKYEAFMAVPGPEPDFHRLQYFADVDLSAILPASTANSKYWQQQT